MPFQKVNDISIYYEIHGEGKKPLVLIGGGGSDHTSYNRMLPELSKHYRILIFANRGAGKSTDSADKETITMEKMAEDAIQLIRELQKSKELPAEKPHIVGCSMGGLIVQEMARKYADEIDHIVLSNTAIKLSEAGHKATALVWNAWQKATSVADALEQLAPLMFSEKLLTPEFIAVLRKTSADKELPNMDNMKRAQQGVIDFDSSSWIHSIKNPCLVVGSTEDKVVPFEDTVELSKAIKGSKFAQLPGGHMSRVEQSALFVEELLKFLPK